MVGNGAKVIMHEVGIVKEILNLALEKASGKKIVRIKIELGEDGHTTEGSLAGAFALISKGTVAEGCRLEIIKSRDLENRLLELEVEK